MLLFHVSLQKQLGAEYPLADNAGQGRQHLYFCDDLLLRRWRRAFPFGCYPLSWRLLFRLREVFRVNIFWFQVLRRLSFAMDRVEVKVEVAQTKWNCQAVRLRTLVARKSLKENKSEFYFEKFASQLLATFSAKCSC